MSDSVNGTAKNAFSQNAEGNVVFEDDLQQEIWFLQEKVKAHGSALLGLLIAGLELDIVKARAAVNSKLAETLEDLRAGVALSRENAALYLGCSPGQLDKLNAKGRIKCVLYDSRPKYRRATLDAFLLKNER